jgi:hypothetical protein
MTLDEFVDAQRQLLERFAQCWRENDNPTELEYGDWEEHFLMFIDDEQG